MKTEVAPPLPGPVDPEPEVDRRRSHRITIVVLVLSGIVGALWVIGPIVYAGRDDPTAIDSKPVRTTVLAGCTQLRADLAAVPDGLSVADRAEAENRAVDRLVGRVRALGPDALAHDDPVEQWLGDWETIVAARRQAVREGRHFSTPIAGGAPVNIRMFELIRSGLGKCDVPEQLLVPQPGAGNR
ncbi:MAG: hypothetical protein QOD57_2898 [Actinomycetota bacterium]|nr:hypothetical protein [Actinomycetota bacterium]